MSYVAPVCDAGSQTCERASSASFNVPRCAAARRGCCACIGGSETLQVEQRVDGNAARVRRRCVVLVQDRGVLGLLAQDNDQLPREQRILRLPGPRVGRRRRRMANRGSGAVA